MIPQKSAKFSPRDRIMNNLAYKVVNYPILKVSYLIIGKLRKRYF